jgi:hypothetical protein
VEASTPESRALLDFLCYLNEAAGKFLRLKARY